LLIKTYNFIKEQTSKNNMFNTSKDQTKRDFERAGESLMEGDVSGASKDLKMGASHTKDLATQDNRTTTEKIGDNISAVGDKLKSAGHSAYQYHFRPYLINYLAYREMNCLSH
jgi:hypothetical protein